MKFTVPSTDLLEALRGEQKECAELLKKDWNNQSLRRVYCRSNYSMIEGHIAYMCAFTYIFNEHQLRPVAIIIQAAGLNFKVPILHDIVAEYETVFLIEKRPQLDQNGNITLRDEYGSFLARFNMCTRMIDKVFKTSLYEQYVNAPARNKLLAGHEIRNRITHPKDISDLQIEDNELEQIVEGCQWVLNFFTDCLRQISQKLADNDQIINKLMENMPHDLMDSIQTNMDKVTEQLSQDDESGGGATRV